MHAEGTALSPSPPWVDGEGVDSDGGGHPSGHLLLGLDGDGADSGVGGHVPLPYFAWCQPSGQPVSQLGSCQFLVVHCLPSCLYPCLQ